MSREINKISLIIGTAGHIDHGKTSLVKALTSIDTDRLIEEKKRGLTIELGFAYIDFEDNHTLYRAAIVDVPGHERFIKNMLTGATGMDLVLFTVAADDGIMPQTIEHLEIIRLLGISEVFFIITKCDLVQKARVDVVAEDILSFISGTVLEGAPFFRVSVKTNEGVEALTRALSAKLLSMKASRNIQEIHAEQSCFRMPIDRSFTIKGFGTVVTGTVAAGTLKKGLSIIAYPSGRLLKARGLESMHIKADKVSAGERAAVNISGLSWKELKRGTCLMSEELEPFLSSVPEIDCTFTFIQKKDVMKKAPTAFRDRALIKVHHHTGETLARIRFAGKKRVLPGETISGRLILRRPLLMMRGDAFILRDPSVNTTVGGGRVVFSYADKDLVPDFKSLTPQSGPYDEDAVLVDLLTLLSRARPGFDMHTLALLLNKRSDKVKSLISSLLEKNNSLFYSGGGFLISQKYALEVIEVLKEMLGSYHEEHPLEEGLTEEDLLTIFIAELKDRKSAESMRPLYRFIISEMVSKGPLLRSHGKLRLKGFNPLLSEVEQNIASQIKKLLQSKGLAMTKLEEIRALGYPVNTIDGVLSYMRKNRELFVIKKDYYIDGGVLDSARKSSVLFITDNGGITAAQCRDILGCGRKLAILILEYFDREGLTIRSGDVRTLA